MNNGNIAESRRVVAHHEAAHAAAAYVLGRRTELVSIRAGEGFSGLHLTRAVDLSDLEVRFVPALLQVPAVWPQQHGLGGDRTRRPPWIRTRRQSPDRVGRADSR